MANYYTWVHDPIVPDEDKPKAVYYLELETNMELIRGYVQDCENAYTSVSLGGVTLGQATHDYTIVPVAATDDKVVGSTTNDLRDALDDVNTSWSSFYAPWTWCGQYSNNGGPVYSARIPPSSIIKIRAIHVNELRRQLDLVDQSILDNAPFCGGACQVNCQVNCQQACQHSCQGCNNSTCHDQMCGWW